MVAIAAKGGTLLPVNETVFAALLEGSSGSTDARNLGCSFLRKTVRQFSFLTL